MLVGPWVGFLLCIAVGIVRPILATHSASTPGATERWLAFFVCAALLVLPLAALPLWIPLRQEAMLALLLLLGAADARGADAIQRRYLTPMLDDLLRPVHETPIWSRDVDALLDAVEERVSANACKLKLSAPESSGVPSDDTDDEAPEPPDPPPEHICMSSSSSESSDVLLHG
jgi:hypothetical protein